MKFGEVLSALEGGRLATRPVPQWDGITLELVPATDGEAARLRLLRAGADAISFPKSDVDLLARDWELADLPERGEKMSP